MIVRVGYRTAEYRQVPYEAKVFAYSQTGMVAVAEFTTEWTMISSRFQREEKEIRYGYYGVTWKVAGQVLALRSTGQD